MHLPAVGECSMLLENQASVAGFCLFLRKTLTRKKNPSFLHQADDFLLTNRGKGIGDLHWIFHRKPMLKVPCSGQDSIFQEYFLARLFQQSNLTEKCFHNFYEQSSRKRIL